MPVIGLICCQVLEMEMAYLLAHDQDIDQVVVLQTEYSGGFSETFEHFSGKPPVETRSWNHAFRGSESTTVLVHVLKVGLHTIIKDLQNGIFDAACSMEPYVDLLFLGYGLCGNALAKPMELLSPIDVPIVIPMDEDHPVDDCVGLVIGGREHYYAEQCKCAGTMFMTAGWANHWKDILMKKDRGTFSLDISKRMLKNYERVLVLSTPVMTGDGMTEYVTEFGDVYGLRTEVREGTLNILEDSWQNAKLKLPSDREP